MAVGFHGGGGRCGSAVRIGGAEGDCEVKALMGLRVEVERIAHLRADPDDASPDSAGVGHLSLAGDVQNNGVS